MGFSQNVKVWAFTQREIESLNPNQNGVYGIYRSGEWLYVGRGDIRNRMLAHLKGDIPGLPAAQPTGWVAELVHGQAATEAREKALILELRPKLNQRVG